MLNVTESASAHLAQLLDEADAPNDAAVRIARSQEGWAILLDNRQPGDQTFEHDGKTVLLVDEMAADLLTDVTLDLDQQEADTRLTLNPSKGGESESGV